MYQYKYGGKDGTAYQLIEAKDLVVVRTKDDMPIEEVEMSTSSRSLLPAMLPVAAFPEANVTVYRVVSTDERSPVSMRNAVRKALKKEANILFAGRVLKDPATGAVVVYTENIYLQFKPEVPQARCEAIIQQEQLRVGEQLGFAVNAWFVKAPEGTGLEVFALSEKLLGMPEVLACHPELVREKKFKFVHPMQWHLRRTVINGMTIDQHASVEDAWALSQGEGITIAILDDGVDTDHDEFKAPGKVVAPRDTVLNTDDARPKTAADRHGTACAGVACAGGMGKAFGVAPAAKLLPIRLGSIGSISEAKAFQWAADHGADIISCSWGPEDGSWWNPNDPLHFSQQRLPDSAKAAIDYAVAKGRDGKGCIITWAAGNGNEDVKFDEYASCPKVIAVAACNDTGSRSVYSDFGQAVWCCFPSNDFHFPQTKHPRPLTPGIWTTDRSGKPGYNSGGVNAEHLVGDLDGKYTATFGGTSSACPGVAGVAALMLALNPDLTWEQVKRIMRDSCDRIDEDKGSYDADGHSPFYGYGRLNALKAAQNAKAAGRPAPAAPAPNFKAKGMASFLKTADLPLGDGQPLGDFTPAQRLTSFQLSLDPFHPDLHLSYKAMVKNLGPTEAGKDGSRIGVPDKRRSLVGISIALEGALAAQFSVEYSVKLKTAGWVTAKNGDWCGSKVKSKGESIEGLKVALVIK